jgi:hypothetical protein
LKLGHRVEAYTGVFVKVTRTAAMSIAARAPRTAWAVWMSKSVSRRQTRIVDLQFLPPMLG